MTSKAYQRKWRKEHMHYSRNWMRRKRAGCVSGPFVMILGVRVRWKWVRG